MQYDPYIFMGEKQIYLNKDGKYDDFSLANMQFQEKDNTIYNLMINEALYSNNLSHHGFFVKTVKKARISQNPRFFSQKSCLLAQ